MPLTDSEVMRIKAELGFPLLTISAEPYIGFASYFEDLLQPYLQEGADTTCSTTVTASKAPTPVTLTLASAAGMFAGARAVVDVDARQETATIQHVSGSTITLLLSLSHTGVFPVTLEGGLTLVRSLLRELANLSTTISSLRTRVGIKKAEDIEFFGGGSTLASQGIDQLTQVLQLREHWRDELASALGIPRQNGVAQGGSDLSMY